MRKYLAKLIFILLLISFLPFLTVKGATIENPLRAKNFWELIGNLIDIIFKITITIAPIMILVAAFYFITAAGEMEKINTAKKIILWVLIGLLVVFCAKAIVLLFRDIIGIEKEGEEVTSCREYCTSLESGRYYRGECLELQDCDETMARYHQRGGDVYCSGGEICCCFKE